MADKRPDKPSDKKPSALHMMPGVEGGHDGVDGRERNSKRTRQSLQLSTQQYIDGVRAGDRTVLGRAITLVESNAAAHQEQAQKVLKAVIPHTGESIRVGITGVPGAGKSTFIEALGLRLTADGHKVAVMAIDPSSSITKGSILGDKTRMELLSRDPNAFIRPSPTGGTLGGVARKTRETMLLFEAAGFDVVLIETVGVGQSEVTVRSMVDFFLLILIAGAGDELQGIKRGVIEIADAIAINKADGDNIEKARRARANYEQALHYLQPATSGWQSPVHTCSATTGDGIADIWEMIERFRQSTTDSGVLSRRRQQQAREWLHAMVEERVTDLFYRHPQVAEALPGIEDAVADGTMPATQAAWQLLELFEKGNR